MDDLVAWTPEDRSYRIRRKRRFLLDYSRMQLCRSDLDCDLDDILLAKSKGKSGQVSMVVVYDVHSGRLCILVVIGTSLLGTLSFYPFTAGKAVDRDSEPDAHVSSADDARYAMERDPGWEDFRRVL